MPFECCQEALPYPGVTCVRLYFLVEVLRLGPHQKLSAPLCLVRSREPGSPVPIWRTSGPDSAAVCPGPSVSCLSPWLVCLRGGGVTAQLSPAWLPGRPSRVCRRLAALAVRVSVYVSKSACQVA